MSNNSSFRQKTMNDRNSILNSNRITESESKEKEKKKKGGCC